MKDYKVLVGLVAGLLVGLIAGSLFSSGPNLGVTTKSGLTLTDGNLTVSSGNATISGTLGVTGASDLGNLTQGGGCYALPVSTTTPILTAAQLAAYNCFEVTASTTADSVTITLPATSTWTTLLPNAGDHKNWLIENQNAAATTTTILKGAGIDLIGVTTNDDVIDGQEWATVDCYRQTDTDVTCYTTELLNTD